VEATEQFAAQNGYRIDNGTVVKTSDVGGFLDIAILQVEVQGILARAAAARSAFGSTSNPVICPSSDMTQGISVVAERILIFYFMRTSKP
ncbi:hypothetical protein K7G98_40175, partial [Saccharothrix sp. MB29]|nr:hypothetical protein [Saccharothrix sp. MB29]